MMTSTSLARRLSLWLLIPLALCGAVLLVTAWNSARHTADRSYDRLLDAASRAMAEQVRWQHGHLWFDLPASALDILAPSGQERVFYTLVDRTGTALSGNAHLPTMAGHDHPSADFSTATLPWHGMMIRLGVRQVTPSGWGEPSPFEIRVAHTLEARDHLARELFMASAWRLLAMLILAALVVVWLIRRSLSPLRVIRRELRRRSANDLSPLALPTPRELKELVNALNDLLARQRGAHAEQQRFIGDASHQLRTPLAGLSARAELALRQEDPAQWHAALKVLHVTSTDAARLASQLLSWTRLHHPESGLENEALTLSTIARHGVVRAMEQTGFRHIDVGLDTEQGDATITGAGWQLEEALANLLDNARRYGASCITVGTRADPPSLWVEDDGPGIEAHERAELMKPFRRGGQNGPTGSGLGLAIVDGIARAHGADLTLTTPSRGGLRVTLTFRTPS
ncbi:sensor histidine kinase [Larsenimonas rhizosphaerae]|uniref:sensor histidine kinase n=1 Tax=Larsenimonas rhizosphaerae TaxID=2944682 RepID=UPI002033F44C|nr:sensor histidine kinase [Larsenimonas rhizosphaerae]MCM2132007.1 sensor histidine kinase [Larsenimonas rhizosphaerae]